MAPTTEALLWPLGFLVALAILCLIAALVPGFRQELRWGRERDGARVTVRGARLVSSLLYLVCSPCGQPLVCPGSCPSGSPLHLSS